MIKTRGLSVSYGASKVVKEIDFTAKAGELTAIIGPNGSGKTTLLSALCGDIKYSGEVWVNEHSPDKTPASKLAEQRAVLAQFTALAFSYTVMEVVRLGLKANTSAGRQVDLANRALDHVSLAGFANRNYLELSGGEQQRVQLARVLCQVWDPVVDGETRWLLLDEPVSSLDILHQMNIMDVAKNYAHRGGGVVAILHDLNLTAMYADTVFMMKNGNVIASGKPAEVLQDKLLKQVYECELKVGKIPDQDVPFVLPHSSKF